MMGCLSVMAIVHTGDNEVGSGSDDSDASSADEIITSLKDESLNWNFLYFYLVRLVIGN